MPCIASPTSHKNRNRRNSTASVGRSQLRYLNTATAELQCDSSQEPLTGQKILRIHISLKDIYDPPLLHAKALLVILIVEICQLGNKTSTGVIARIKLVVSPNYRVPTLRTQSPCLFHHLPKNEVYDYQPPFATLSPRRKLPTSPLFRTLATLVPTRTPSKTA